MPAERAEEGGEASLTCPHSPSAERARITVARAGENAEHWSNVKSTWRDRISHKGSEELFIRLARLVPTFFSPCYSFTICYLPRILCLMSIILFNPHDQGSEVVCQPHFRDVETKAQRLTQEHMYLINGEALT